MPYTQKVLGSNPSSSTFYFLTQLTIKSNFLPPINWFSISESFINFITIYHNLWPLLHIIDSTSDKMIGLMTQWKMNLSIDLAALLSTDTTPLLLRVQTLEHYLFVYEWLVVGFTRILHDEVTFLLLVFCCQWYRPKLIQVLQVSSILLLSLLVRNVLPELLHSCYKLWFRLVVKVSECLLYTFGKLISLICMNKEQPLESIRVCIHYSLNHVFCSVYGKRKVLVLNMLSEQDFCAEKEVLPVSN